MIRCHFGVKEPGTTVLYTYLHPLPQQDALPGSRGGTTPDGVLPRAASTVRLSPALVSVSVAVVPASTSISSPATELPTVALCPAWTPNIVAALLSVRVSSPPASAQISPSVGPPCGLTWQHIGRESCRERFCQDV